MNSVHLHYPVVLINGVIFPQTLGPLSYFHRIEKIFPYINFKTINLPPFGTQSERMELLKHQLAAYSEKEFHVLGHSQGGIEGRLLLEEKEYQKKILTLISINSPFKGTSVLAYFPFLKKRWQHYIQYLNSPLSPQNVVPHFCANTFIHNPEDFKHYPMFRWLNPRILPEVGVNDGFVGLESMRMGDEILLQDGDHLANIGWPLHLGQHLMGAMGPYLFFNQIFQHLSEWEMKR